MGTIAARKCREILDNVEHVIAVELLCAAQALDLLNAEKPYRPGDGTHAAYKVIREHIPYLDTDRVISQDIETMVSLIRSGAILRRVEEVVGELA